MGQQSYKVLMEIQPKYQAFSDYLSRSTQDAQRLAGAAGQFRHLEGKRRAAKHQSIPANCRR